MDFGAATMAAAAAIMAVEDTTKATEEAGSGDGLDGCITPAIAWESPTPARPSRAGSAATASARAASIAAAADAPTQAAAGSTHPTPAHSRGVASMAPRTTGDPVPASGAVSERTGGLPTANRMRAVLLHRATVEVPTSGRRLIPHPRTGGAPMPPHLRTPADTARRGTLEINRPPAGRSRVATWRRPEAIPLRRSPVLAITAEDSGPPPLPPVATHRRARSPLLAVSAVDLPLRTAVFRRRDHFPLPACRAEAFQAAAGSRAVAAFPADTPAAAPSAVAAAVDVTARTLTRGRSFPVISNRAFRHARQQGC